MPRTQAPLSLEYILLGLLDEQPMHGYDLHKRLTSMEGIGLVWQIKQAQLYAFLEKLESDGLLDGTLVQAENRPARKLYRPSSVGRQTFRAWLRSPVLHEREIRQEFLARLYFARHEGTDAVLELLEDQINICYEWMETIQINMASLRPDQDYERMVYEYRIYQVRATLDWLNAVRRELR